MTALFGGMTTEKDMGLVQKLRDAARGTEEWRVADPADGCYCISFSWADCSNPEREAKEWLEDHRTRFPNSRHAHYEVRRVMAQNSADMLMIEAAEELERLGDAANQAAEVLRQEATILCDCHTLAGEWDDTEPEVKANYDRMMALADRLTPNAEITGG